MVPDLLFNLNRSIFENENENVQINLVIWWNCDFSMHNPHPKSYANCATQDSSYFVVHWISIIQQIYIHVNMLYTWYSRTLPLRPPTPIPEPLYSRYNQLFVVIYYLNYGEAFISKEKETVVAIYITYYIFNYIHNIRSAIYTTQHSLMLILHILHIGVTGNMKKGNINWKLIVLLTVKSRYLRHYITTPRNFLIKSREIIQLNLILCNEK